MAETAVPQNFQSEKLLDKGGKFIRGCILRWEIKLFFFLFEEFSNKKEILQYIHYLVSTTSYRSFI